ncbi:MAG: hypothetical protein GX271_11850 [Clostridiales bacterium]|nr:hypothetical protein [Clostridiales bacterium]
MIDIHTHILPYMDDGAKDTGEAMKMIDFLRFQGIDIAVCTPHFDPSSSSIKEFTENREKAFQTISTDNITLIAGSETGYHDLLYQYSDLNQICISNTSYLLLELPYKNFRSEYLLENIDKLMSLFYIIPIIAHIERYNALWKSKINIKKLLGLGCITQINADTIIDKKKRRTALHYIKSGLIDLIGSDCHNMSRRPPNLKDAFVIIEKEIGSSYCDLLKKNANSIIKGEMIREEIARPMLRGSEF